MHRPQPNEEGRRQVAARDRRDVTLSVLETRFLTLLRAHGLPLPRTNINRGGDKVDCHWPELDLTVELVSYRFPATREAFEEDVTRRRRSGHIAYSYGDVFQRGAATAAELRAIMRRRAA